MTTHLLGLDSSLRIHPPKGVAGRYTVALRLRTSRMFNFCGMCLFENFFFPRHNAVDENVRLVGRESDVARANPAIFMRSNADGRGTRGLRNWTAHPRLE